jgi:hypothetical protein
MSQEQLGLTSLVSGLGTPAYQINRYGNYQKTRPATRLPRLISKSI